MINFILFFATVCFAFQVQGQIMLGQVSDFEDGTTEGWSNGASSPNPPTNVPTGGPNGADDNFLEEVSSGGSGSGSKMVIQNNSSAWTGDYFNANVNTLSFHAKNGGAEDLYLRVAFKGGSENTEIVSTEFVHIPASQNSWIPYAISFIGFNEFMVVNGSNSISEVILDVIETRIISSENGNSYSGDTIAGTLHIDNIMADITLLGFDDKNLSDLVVYPNPVSDVLNLSTSGTLDSYDIYTITGQRVDGGALSQSFVQVSNLSRGLYFIEVSNEFGTKTIKFVKR